MPEVLEAVAGLIRGAVARGARQPQTARITVDLRGVGMAVVGIFDDEVQ